MRVERRAPEEEDEEEEADEAEEAEEAEEVADGVDVGAVQERAIRGSPGPAVARKHERHVVPRHVKLMMQ